MNHAKTSLLLAGALALLAVPAFANYGKAAQADKFKSVDANGDGRISREEQLAHSQQMFTAVDTNHDGTLSAAEINASTELKSDKHATEELRKVDTNNDGLITKAEQEANCDAMFGKLDTNGDGYISEAEFSASHDKMKVKK
jgi:Ca2+-binding EF-hand superfamily protein